MSVKPSEKEDARKRAQDTHTEEEKKRLRECHYIRCRKCVIARLFRHRVGPRHVSAVSAFRTFKRPHPGRSGTRAALELLEPLEPY